jgi:hypothetical protein
VTRLPCVLVVLALAACAGCGDGPPSDDDRDPDPGTPGDRTPPVTVADPPAARTYQGPVTVTLRSDEPATTYYTTDGAAPTAASPRYLGPIVLDRSTTLRFFSVDLRGNPELAQSHRYRVDIVRRLLLDVAVQ